MTTSVKWSRPPLPKIDPKEDKIVFQQLEVDYYTGEQRRQQMSTGRGEENGIDARAGEWEKKLKGTSDAVIPCCFGRLMCTDLMYTDTGFTEPEFFGFAESDSANAAGLVWVKKDRRAHTHTHTHTHRHTH